MANDRRFGRNYYLKVQVNSITRTDYVEVRPPFTIEFDITRNILTSGNVCSIRVLNLKSEVRNQILKNQFDFSNNKTVLLQAGYGTDEKHLPIIFNGYVTRIFSVREGNNMVTEIQAFDGGNAYVNGYYDNPPLPAGTPLRDFVIDVAGSMAAYGTVIGAIGAFTDANGEETILGRPVCESGPPMEILKRYTNGGTFIDNGKVNCLGPNEVIKTPQILVVSAESGLLNTPVREPTYITFEMIFEPKMQIGIEFEMRSVTADKSLNTFYKVMKVQHRGMISPAVCGEAITSIGAFFGTGLLNKVDRES